jgi:hypothetical protein
MNPNQIIYLQSGLGVLLALALFLSFYAIFRDSFGQTRVIKSSGAAIAVLVLVWGFLFCGLFQVGVSETFAAAFSDASISADPWGTSGLFRILSISLGLSLVPWALFLLVAFGGGI